MREFTLATNRELEVGEIVNNQGLSYLVVRIQRSTQKGPKYDVTFRLISMEGQ